jgi:hypothetical protein
MEKKVLFERNLLALSGNNPRLCSRLSAASTGGNVYRFLESRTGEIIPALTLPSGSARPLHSTVDPVREARRLVSTISGEGFLVFLGLGGGFAPRAALEREETRRVLIIEYGCGGAAELLCMRDYISLLGDPRVSVLLDPGAETVETYLTRHYQPVLDGGIRVFPLLPRTEGDAAFTEAAKGIKRAIDASSRDYSVQAWFGKRWFSNILQNLPLAEKSCWSLPPVRKAAVTAAGPSLDGQLSLLKKERSGLFLLATDTSLPALLGADIVPDGVLSIDCQHISYQHFFTAVPKNTFLFLDLASPHTVAARAEKCFFLAGGHPLTRYIRTAWRPLPELDTSGANVTYAACSLAESLGAREISLYGADFSYPEGKTYARDTYIYPFFEKSQNRFSPMEAQHSAFLYRGSFLEKLHTADGWRYETGSLKFYRSKLEKKTAISRARLLIVPGSAFGGTDTGRTDAAEGRGQEFPERDQIPFFAQGGARCGAAEFLARYKTGLEALSSFDETEDEKRNLVTTILPAAAAFRRIMPSAAAGELFAETRAWCLDKLEQALRNQG